MSPVTWPRVLIASDQASLSNQYADLLQPEFQVVGTVTDEQALMAGVRELKPDVVILDLGESWVNRMETGARIKKLTRMVRIVYITTTIPASIAADAAHGGVSGYLQRTSDDASVLDAVREVLKGRRFISASLVNATDGQALESHLGRKSLTGRELEVLKLLAEGRTMKEIAYILTLTPRTIAFHKYKLMERLCLQTNAELVQYAIQEQILAPRTSLLRLE